MQSNCITLIFSKDRALQLDATLSSFILHNKDSESASIRILYTTTSDAFSLQYQQVAEAYAEHKVIKFIKEKDFYVDLLALLAPYDYILFLVDDNIFIRDFSLFEAIRQLKENKDALGYSLRLGKNTIYCYALDKGQQLPHFKAVGRGILKYNWVNAEYDFGYPLELSSSVYRTEEIIPFIAPLKFKNPNTLEALMAEQKSVFSNEKPFSLCYEKSVTFCAPLNKVQITFTSNRASTNSEYSIDNLARLFTDGYKIDVASYQDFVPNGCHQEIELNLIRPKAVLSERRPFVSVIIPCYNQAHFLPEAVGSIVNQTYPDWECIIVNDGSSDNTSEVVKQLAAKFSSYRIRLLEKTNGGLSDARNAGIREAQGEWILPLDSDDMFAADFLEKAASVIQRDPAVNLVTTNYQAFGEKSHEWIPNDYTPERILYEDTFIYASLYKKDLWEEVGGYYAGIPWGAEDWNFWIACSKIGIKPARIHGKLFLYRTHSGTSMYDRMMEHWDEVKAIIRTLHPDLYPKELLLSYHEVISAMHVDTAAKLDNILSKFPDLSMPYFWRGLTRAKDGNIIDAINDFKKSVELSEHKEWQPLLYLGLLEKASGNNDQAEYCFREVVRLLSGDPGSECIVQQLYKFIPQKNLKILFYYAELHNSDKPFAGTSMATVTLASAMAKTGNFSRISVTGDFIKRHEVVEGVTFLPLPAKEQRKPFLGDYDAVVFATHLRYFADIPKPERQVWILHQHCWAIEPQEILRISDFDFVLCLSDIHRAALLRQGVPEKKLNILPNIVDMKRFHPISIERSPHSIMFAGAVVPLKGVHILVDAFTLVRDRIPDAELHVYGSASMWRQSEGYEKSLKRLNIPGVLFHGLVPNDEMPNIYSQHSILCLPSAIESFGMVTVEAQACGCIPVVHNTSGTQATLIDGQTGFLYAPNTPEVLATTLLKALSYLDRDDSLRRNALQFVSDNFSLEKNAEHFTHLLQGALQSSNIQRDEVNGSPEIKKSESHINAGETADIFIAKNDISVTEIRKEKASRLQIGIWHQKDITIIPDSPGGGCAIAVKNFAEAWARSGHNVTVYCHLFEAYQPQTVNQVQYKDVTTIGSPANFESCNLIIGVNRFDIFKFIEKSPRQTFICWMHYPEYENFKEANALCDSLMFGSGSFRDECVAKGADEKKSFVVPIGIDLNAFAPQPFDRKKHTILFSGRLIPEKGYQTAIDALRLVHRTVPDAELHLYGNEEFYRSLLPSEQPKVEAKSEEKGIFFHGVVPHNKMPEIYSQYDIICLPSEAETFGLVLVEAQACGCIPVAHDTGAIPEVVSNNHTGFLYVPNTAEELAKTILKALDATKADGSIRTRARDFIRQNFEIGEQAARFIALIAPAAYSETTEPALSSVEPANYSSLKELPIHFFTIVLNGEPFIRHHIEVFKKLPFKWHWHIIEGVADLKHDTAWSLRYGGEITDELHRNGFSNDGTTEYLDELARQYPDNITIYRKQAGVFWDGKLEMINAPIAHIREECLLWQVDADELWTIDQICNSRSLYGQQPDKTASFYFCHYFVGENLVITTRNTYGNHTDYEWIRTWRFKPGDHWIAHEPPRLCRQVDGRWNDLATINPFKHSETEAKGLVFQHFAYTTEKQLYFKERYFGYKGAVNQWKSLQQQIDFPVFLKDFFKWVTDHTQVDTAKSRGLLPIAQKDINDNWHFENNGKPLLQTKQILWIRTDSIGDNVLAASMLPYIREKYRQARITVLCQEHIAELYATCSFVDNIVTFNMLQAYQNENYRNEILKKIQALTADLCLNSVYSRELLTDFFSIGSNAKEKIAFNGNLCNIKKEIRDESNEYYTSLLSSDKDHKPELERLRDFLEGLSIEVHKLEPQVWLSSEDDQFAKDFFRTNKLDPEKTLVFCPGAQISCKLYSQFEPILTKFTNFDVVILGDKKDIEQTNEFCRKFKGKCYNLAGKTTLRQTASIIRRCRLLFGVDSACAHIACAVGTPNVIILGGGHFGRFLPYSPLTSIVCLPLECYDCNWRCKYKQIHCVQDILPGVFAEAIRQTLKSPSKKPRVFVQGKALWKLPACDPNWKRFDEFLNPESVEIINIETPPVISGGTLEANEIIKQEAKSQVKVSAIVSTYNSERFIKGCLEDLVNQTLYKKNELEILIVDSGSQQNETAIVKKFRQKHKNIQYIRTKNRESVYAAWNRGIRAAKGKYITNANADDRHHYKAFEVMVNTLDEHSDIGLVYADVIITETENETFEKNTRVSHFKWPDYDREKLSVGCFIGPQPMWRKSLHDKYGYFDETFSSSGDWEFWLRIAEGTDFLHIPEFLGLYLRTPESLEHKNTEKRIEEDRTIYRTYIPKYLPEYELYLTRTLGINFSDPDSVCRYGQIMSAFDKFDKAIDLYKAYLRIHPGDKGFSYLLQVTESLKARQIPSSPPPTDALPSEVMLFINKADAHIAAGDLASAREAVKQAISHASGHPQLCSMLSDMLDNLPSPECAAEFLGTKKKSNKLII